MATKEYVASCPKCKTFETLWFKGDIMTPTKKFVQRKNGRVFHDCGAEEPCQLFPRFVDLLTKAQKGVKLVVKASLNNSANKLNFVDLD
jgi:hypothetical protein